jgi:hypothetical protein
VGSRQWRDLLDRRKGGTGYAELAEKLHAIGVKGESERNIANKIARGSFTAVFFVQCSAAIGCHTVHLENT